MANNGEQSSKRMKLCDEVQTMPTKEVELRYVEFYSGVGGWTMALKEAASCIADMKVNLRRIAALDHSDLCTKVFEHNFGTDKKSFAIERLSLQHAEEWKATIWAMSPPCQPHTRQHENQESDMSDPRSASFLHIIDLMGKMRDEFLPSIVFVENVVGFESSKSFEKWSAVLSQRDYQNCIFHLTPTQVGLPNDRPRFFSIAIQKSILAEGSTEQNPLLSYMSTETRHIFESIPELSVKEKKEPTELPAIGDFLDNNNGDSHLRIPPKILKSNSSWCFDIVTPTSRRSSCFTHSYGRYVRGTGSILYSEKCPQIRLVSPEEREFQDDWAKSLDLSKLRYFSGIEMARLMGFSEDFSFPSDCSMKQQWKLIGNSLNVRVASRIVELGLQLVQWQKL